MNKTKIAVLVSGGGTNLQALIDYKKDNRFYDISLVISNNSDAYALTRAKLNNICAEVVLKGDFKTQEAFEEQIINLLEKHNIDLIVLAGFMCILTQNFTSKYENRIINVHPSLIPSFCGKGFYGLKVHEAALEYGVKVTGATVHFVNEIPDGGKIIMQKAVEILPNDTPESLQKRVMEQAEWIILPEAVNNIAKEYTYTRATLQ